MSIMLTIVAIIYAIIGFFLHMECIKLKAEDDDSLWEELDRNSWPVELAFLFCSILWPIVLIVYFIKKGRG